MRKYDLILELKIELVLGYLISYATELSFLQTKATLLSS